MPSRDDFSLQHNVLREFLASQPDDLVARLRLDRAIKARQKLLKLLSAQFGELSTDVYDELGRRRGESEETAEYLVARPTFHPKRNQARQKLALLPASRFRDLVNDILYEIERRGLHAKGNSVFDISDLERSAMGAFSGAKESDRSNSVSHSRGESVSHSRGESVSHSRKESTSRAEHPTHARKESSAMNYYHSRKESLDSRKISSGSRNGSGGSVSRKESTARPTPPSHALKSSTVVPTKANLAWLSDEEEPVPKHSSRDKNREIELLLEEGTKMDSQITRLERQLSEANAAASVKQSALRRENEDLRNAAAEAKRREQELADKVAALETSAQRERDLEDKVASLESAAATLRDVAAPDLSAKVATLEAALAAASSAPDLSTKVASLETALAAANTRAVSLQTSHDTALATIATLQQLPATKADPSALSAIREEFTRLTLRLDERPVLADVSREASLWQEKYEAARTEVYTQHLVDLPEAMVSPEGVIPVGLLAQLSAAYDLLMTALQDPLPATLFARVSRLAVVASDMATLVPPGNHAALVKAAVAHAITTVRYFAVYPAVVPRLVVVSAANEVMLAVADLVGVFKVGNSQPRRTAAAVATPVKQEDPVFVKPQISADLAVRPLSLARKFEGKSPTAPTELRFAGARGLNLTKKEEPEPVSPTTPKKATFDADKSSSFTASTPKKEAVAELAARFSPESSTAAHKPLEKASPQRLVNLLERAKAFESPKESSYKVQHDKASPDKLVTDKLVTDKSSTDSMTSAMSDKLGRPDTTLDKPELTALDVEPPEPYVDVTDTYGAPSPVSAGGFKWKVRSSSKGSVSEDKKNETSTDTVVAPDLAKPSYTSPFKRVEVTLPTGAAGEWLRNASTKSVNLVRSGKSTEQRSPVQQAVSATAERKASGGSVKSVGDASKGSAESQPSATSTFLAGFKKTFLLSRAGREEPGKAAKAAPEVAVPETVEEPAKPLPKPPAVSESVQSVNSYASAEEPESEGSDYDEDEPASRRSSASIASSIMRKRRARQSEAARQFDVELFDIDNPDNTLTQLLLYLEHQTVDVISTIQSLLSLIKMPESTRGELRAGAGAIGTVVRQMTDATNTLMNQTRNAQLKEHGLWVVRLLEDCGHRMGVLCARGETDQSDEDYADKNFKQRLAGIAFDVAKCTKELVKTVEEASIREEIEYLDKKLHGGHAAA